MERNSTLDDNSGPVLSFFFFCWLFWFFYIYFIHMLDGGNEWRLSPHFRATLIGAPWLHSLQSLTSARNGGQQSKALGFQRLFLSYFSSLSLSLFFFFQIFIFYFYFYMFLFSPWLFVVALVCRFIAGSTRYPTWAQREKKKEGKHWGVYFSFFLHHLHLLLLLLLLLPLLPYSPRSGFYWRHSRPISTLTILLYCCDEWVRLRWAIEGRKSIASGGGELRPNRFRLSFRSTLSDDRIEAVYLADLLLISAGWLRRLVAIKFRSNGPLICDHFIRNETGRHSHLAQIFQQMFHHFFFLNFSPVSFNEWEKWLKSSQNAGISNSDRAEIRLMRSGDWLIQAIKNVAVDRITSVVGLNRSVQVAIQPEISPICPSLSDNSLLLYIIYNYIDAFFFVGVFIYGDDVV